MAGALSKTGRVLGTLLMILGLMFLCFAGGIGYVYLTKKGEVSFDSKKMAFYVSMEAPVEKAGADKKDVDEKGKSAKTSDEVDFSKPAIDQLNYARNYSLPQEYKAGEYFRAARAENLSKLEKDLALLNDNMKKMQELNDRLDAKLKAREEELRLNKLKVSNDALRSVANILNKAGIETVVGALTGNQPVPLAARFTAQEEDEYYGLFFLLKGKSEILTQLTELNPAWNTLFTKGYGDWLKKNNLSDKDLKQ